MFVPSKLRVSKCRTAIVLAGLLVLNLNSEKATAQPPQDDPQTGVTIQLPVLGVSVDAAGVLSVNPFTDVDGRLRAERLDLVRRTLPMDVQKPTKLRKVSLRRLENAIQVKLANDLPLNDEMRYLAGLQKAEFVILLPEENDIILAGPAEAWIANPAGRIVGVSTGMPTLLLDDLLVALRTFPNQAKVKTWVACSINPTAQGIQDLVEFQKQIPKRISDSERNQITPQLAKGLRDSLGMTNIAVYGVPRTSNLSRVMVEADYRMKLIAVGLEPPPVLNRRLITFIDALTGAPKNMQRWWLTPEYKCVKNANDGLAIQLVGRGVSLKTENIQLASVKAPPRKNSKRAKLKPSRAARSYATSFTKLYPEISRQRPVFAQLRNVIDLLVVSAWIAKQDGFEKVDWQPRLLLDSRRLPTNALPDIKQAPSVANAVWKGNLLVLPVGGGVSIQASEALEDSNLLPDKSDQVSKTANEVRLPKDGSWWWD